MLDDFPKAYATADWRRAQRKRSRSIAANGAVFGRRENRSRCARERERERERERTQSGFCNERKRERRERQESSILLTSLLVQSSSWKTDRTRNEKERWGFSSGGGAVEGETEGVRKGKGGFDDC